VASTAVARVIPLKEITVDNSKIVRLPQAREIYPLVRSGALTAMLPAMLKFLPVPRVLSAIEPRKRCRDSSLTVYELAHIANAVSRRGPRFGVGECLIRSFVLYNLLRRFAYDPVLVIGGRLAKRDLDCHSWIEIDGEPLCESNNPNMNFKVLYVYTEPKL
jgi:hypothetical protein